MAYKKIGDILLDANLITSDQLNMALDKSKETKKRLGEYLIDAGIISESQLIDVLKLQLGIDFIDLTKTNIPVSLASLVPKNLAKQYGVVPVKEQGDVLYLAMSDPLNFYALEEVKSATKKRIIPLIATSSAIERSIVMLYGNEGVSKAIDEMQRSFRDTEEVKEEKIVADETNEQAAPAIKVVNTIIERAVAENASDIHIEPREKDMVIRMRIDGVLHPILVIPSNMQNAVISRVKVMSNMDIAEKRIPQDGRASIRSKGKDIDLRVSTLPTEYGEKVVLRFLEKSDSLLSTDGIGLEGKHLEEYKKLLENSNGVILISGPTGSGKSTTMYTMISELNKDDVNIVTLEDPIEYNIDGVNQVQVNEKVGLTFANGLRSILRQDPDIISVGEIRDGETAEIAMRAAITGHLVLSTIHTNSAIATLDRLEDIGVEPYLIASALKGVVSQRLVRKICPNCKRAYEPTKDELDSLGISEEAAKQVKFFKGEGCSECLHTGYKGRTAAFEILTLTSEIKEAFRNKVSHKELTDVINRTGFRPLKADALKLAAEGVTTLSEAIRITHTTDD